MDTFVMLSRGSGDITVEITVSPDFKWEVYFFNKLVPRNSPIFSGIDDTLDADKIKQVFQTISSAQQCVGNADIPSVMKNTRTDFLHCNDGCTTVYCARVFKCM